MGSCMERILSTSAAFAFEVMDKEWPLWLVIVSFLGAAIAGPLIGRKWPILCAFVALLIVVGAVRQISELNDQYVGPNIRAEAGFKYFVASYLSITTSVVLLVAGLVQGLKRRKRLA